MSKLKVKTKKANRLFKPQAFDYIMGFALLILGIALLYPFWWVLATSIAEPVWLSSNTVMLWPEKVSLEAYKFIFSEGKIWRSMYNSFIYASSSSMISVFVCALYAYPLSLPRFKLRKFYNVLILIPMFLSAGAIPSYINMMNLGLLGSRLAVILPGAISATYVIILRTHFKGVSSELRDAALIDGANELRIFFQIVLPLSKSVFMVIVMYAFVASWNSYMPALLYLRDGDHMPLSIYLRDLLITETTDAQELALAGSGDTSYYQSIAAQGGGIGMRQSIKNGTIVVSVLPIMLLYPFVQRYFVKGIMVGSVKG